MFGFQPTRESSPPAPNISGAVPARFVAVPATHAKSARPNTTKMMM